MGLLSEPANPVWSFPFTPQDWEQTPRTVQAYVRTLRDEVVQLHDRVETLEARLTQNSTTSSKPPSSDSPFKKPRRLASSTTPRKAGGKPGHPGHRQVLLPPTTVQELRPEQCACGNTTFALTTPYHTHQVLELPPIAMDVTHCKPCHDLLYISGDFRRLYPVGTNSKRISCEVDNGSRAGRLNGRGRYSTKDSCGVSGSSEPWGDAKRVE